MMKYVIGLMFFIFSMNINAQKMDSLKLLVFDKYADKIGESFRFEDYGRILFKTKLVLKQINYYIYDSNGNTKYDSLINHEYDKKKKYYAYSILFEHKRTKEKYIMKPLVDMHLYYIANDNKLPKLVPIITMDNNFRLILDK